MKTKTTAALLGAMALTVGGMNAAEVAKESTPKPVAPGKQLFPDDVLCKGKGVEVKRSQLDEAFSQFRANLAVRGQTVPEDKRAMYEAQLLDRLVITTLLVSRATEEDKKKAREQAETRKQAGSEESFQRQLKAMAFSTEQFDAQIIERAICEEVVERQLKSKVNITDEQAKKYYEENGDRFERPEMVRASHILLATRDAVTGQEFSEEKKKEKHQQIEKVLERAKKGEDFAALAKEFSEDPGSKDNGGEYTFPRGQMVPEFENAAFSLNTNQVSGIVTTQFGYHIIKLHEKTPKEKTEFAKVEKDLKEFLARQEVQEKMLPDFLKQIKKEAGLEYLNGAKPPETPDEKPAAKPQ
jgi:peptidyl-prolyl cis-trans isomerase C